MKSILKTIGVFAISILAIAIASYANEVKALDSLGGLPALNIQANDSGGTTYSLSLQILLLMNIPITSY